ncbi:hypothetical protein ADEAN_000799900 [Angomonas deanei]|uniref:Uncharacterized protein n=1 Tax=Angomonas deanei TaxID=59799 RepID=A0A7G2CN27_9TRYP|nr:hypothetical protein ADEAN_000799900 [Angomonas deanei]
MSASPENTTEGRRSSSIKSPSKYTNANGHQFRDVGPYEPSKNDRIKCKFCGCWAKKGKACYQCHRTADGTLVKPKKRTSTSQPHTEEQEHEPSDEEVEESSVQVTSTADEAEGRRSSSIKSPSKYTNANGHQFRDVGPYEPSKNDRIKCKFCGCWAKKGKACYQCHRTADGTLVKPKKRASTSQPHTEEQEHEPSDEEVEESSVQVTSTADEAEGRRSSSIKSPSKYTNANGHQFRDVGPYEPSKNDRIKCKFCGCWAKKGKACYQCHRTADGTLVKPKKRTSTSQSTD